MVAIEPEATVATFFAGLGQSKIQQLRARFGEHDVSGLQVAMHNAVTVCRLQHLGNFKPVLQRLLERQRTFFQPVGERLALQQLHDQIIGPVLRADVVEMADMRVAQGRNRFGLAFKTRFEIRVGTKMRWQDFDGYISTQSGVARTVHLAHAACTQRRLDLVRPELRAISERHSCA